MYHKSSCQFLQGGLNIITFIVLFMLLLQIVQHVTVNLQSYPECLKIVWPVAWFRT